MDTKERIQMLRQERSQLVERLAHIDAALRNGAEGACLSHALHITLMTMGGNPYRSEMLPLFPGEADAPFGLHGYQINQCVDCGQFILCRYDGAVIGAISTEQATRWASIGR